MDSQKPTVLLTAFDPYGQWPENASLLCLGSLLSEPIPFCRVIARIYPVDFARIRELIVEDLRSEIDYVIHLGQAPQRNQVDLELVGRNLRRDPNKAPDGPGAQADLQAKPEQGGLGSFPADQQESTSPVEVPALDPQAPAEYRSGLPLERWAAQLAAAGIPTRVSQDAGSYLCNAALFWSLHHLASLGRPAHATFVHLPLSESQTTFSGEPTLPTATLVQAVRLVLTELVCSRDSV